MKSLYLKIFFGIISFFSVFSTNAQVEKIQSYFEALKKDKKHPEATISFVQEEMGLVEDYSKLSQIILVRHGEPALNKTRRRNRKEAIQFAKDYDSVGIYAPAFIPVTITADELKVIHTSSINRSISTAQQVFNREDLQQPDTLFREFERKIFPFPNIRLRTKWWSIGSRALWFLGFNKKGVESFSKAKKRVERAADFLILDAVENKKTLLVSHGLLNRYLAKDLKKKGWTEVYNGGHGYLSQKMFVKYVE